jgi:predicted CXXCH cytochrome family protein
MSQKSRRIHGLIAVLALVGLTGACVDERVVFRDRELFTDPPAGAADFLGYTNQETRLTVCGNCHINNQSEWEGTAHAGAWETLEASGHAQARCEGCHAVSALGNATAGMVGWDATRDERYHDVQCENCHGPGLAHVSNPQSTNIPLAPLMLGANGDQGCGECHTGTHHPFADEWEQSAHATIRSVATRTGCEDCHSGEGALADWGITANFLEKDSLRNNTTASMAITCGVCHDPHARDVPGQLRFPIDVPSITGNLCMRCHNRRGEPDFNSATSGPHSPQGQLLIGTAGWWPPNLTLPPGSIVATHGSELNPRLCATCHVARFEVTDEETGDFQFQATGHLFKAIPCLNAEGLPTTDDDCAVTERTFQACTGAGCHSAVGARSAYIAAEGRAELLAEALLEVLQQIPASELNNSDGRYSTAEGANFNLGLVSSAHGTERELVRGSIIHNPFLVEALLTASIRQIEIDYGISAPPGVVLDNILQKKSSK